MLAGEVSYVVVVDVAVAGESPWDLRLTEPIREVWEEDMAREDSRYGASNATEHKKHDGEDSKETPEARQKGHGGRCFYRIIYAARIFLGQPNPLARLTASWPKHNEAGE